MKTLRFVVALFFVVLMGAGFAAGQTETTGFPVEMNGGLMNSLGLSGYNTRLFTELHRDSCQGPLINEDEQNSFKKGQVLYLCENAVINQTRIKSFLLWANTNTTAEKKVAPESLAITAQAGSSVQTVKSGPGPIITLNNAIVATAGKVNKKNAPVTSDANSINPKHAVAITPPPQLQGIPQRQYSYDIGIPYLYIGLIIFAVIILFILTDCYVVHKRYQSSVSFGRIVADYFPDKLDSLKEWLMFLGRITSNGISARVSPRLGTRLFKFFDTAT